MTALIWNGTTNEYNVGRRLEGVLNIAHASRVLIAPCDDPLFMDYRSNIYIVSLYLFPLTASDILGQQQKRCNWLYMQQHSPPCFPIYIYMDWRCFQIVNQANKQLPDFRRPVTKPGPA